MVSISVRPERYSYNMIKETGEFVVNLVTEDLTYACDYCGVKSGRDVDKFAEMQLDAMPALGMEHAMAVAQAPAYLSCKVRQVIELGSHDMFLADIVAVDVDPKYVDEKGALHMEKAGLLEQGPGEVKIINSSPDPAMIRLSYERLDQGR